jgi:hypothetical protein
MPLKVYEIYDFANVFWNDFTPKSVAMSMTWYYWSFGFCSVAKNYDSQIVLRSIVYHKSMALDSYFGSKVYLGNSGAQKRKSIPKFQNLQCKGFAVYLD